MFRLDHWGRWTSMRDITMKINRFNIGTDKVFLLIFLLLFMSRTVRCFQAAKTSTMDVNSEIMGEEKEAIIGNVNDLNYEQVERGNEKLEETTLTAIYV